MLRVERRWLGVMVVCGLVACGADAADDAEQLGNNGAGASGAVGSSGSGDSTGNGFGPSSGSGTGEACADVVVEAELQSTPVDIIFIIDNSGSMGDEIASVRANINDSFAQIIGDSGVDYRVIMVSEHGGLGNESVCIEEPLSGIPTGGCNNPPAQPVAGERFFHFSVPIDSEDSWCQLIDYWDAPDEFNSAPGWGSLLRDGTFKIFVELTDDRVDCQSQSGPVYDDGGNAAQGQSAAALFDADLLALSPAHFGSSEARNYRWYSMVALGNKDPNDPTVPWLPADPITTTECATAAAVGTGYQALSITTEGLRFPLCEFNHYDVVFEQIAQGIVDGAKLACDVPLPEAPPGETVDLSSVAVTFTPDGGSGQHFSQVDGAANCTPDGFYIDAGIIHLCPGTCDTVQAVDKAELAVSFSCEQIAN